MQNKSIQSYKGVTAVTLFKTVLQSYCKSNNRYWPKADTWINETVLESPDMNLPLYDQLIYNKRGKNIKWGKDNLFNAGKTGQL